MWTKNRMPEKINIVNVCFLVLSVYKVQNRLLSKIPESKIVASRCTNPAKHGKISV